jgi:SnoaL-like domain
LLDLRNRLPQSLRKGEKTVTVEERLQRLEDDRAIRDLKARYLRACDTKDPQGVRDTLIPNGAIIAYEGFPPFSDRDDFVAIYAQMGCGPEIFDIHHGANGIISFESETRATGKWSLFFHNINLAARSLTQMGVEYDDVYVKQDGRWWIAQTYTKRTSCLIHSVDDAGKPMVTVIGDPPAAFGEP